MIFADTSFWVGLVNRRDDRHADAMTLMTRYGDVQMLTTSHVRGETWTFLRRRADHRIACGFLDAIDRSPRVKVIHVAEPIEVEATDWLRRHDERPYSFVNATSFATMTDLALRDAFAFDADFVAAGFNVLPA